MLGASTTVGAAMKKSASEVEEQEKTADQQNGEWEDVKEKKEQKVYVLDQGFIGWQQVYGEDERLTEGYVKDLWKDGY